ncbi:otefin [Drosophila kikkawai]|uniref:Otefin n=1 Tax=Drosophila kikkawai TaxID=30033 RepID=A0A6P4IAV4_DROKI|nr:otefin [Drosophila kikkawai]
MADVDDLDALSNAELRAKMLAQGLPNIPVTDSSRKVLVKRLRASIGGQASPAAAASPKKSNRRETLAPSAAPAAASTPVDKLDGNKVAPATKARRTITAAEAKEAERRRPEEPVARKPTSTTSAAPAIQTRRTSTSSSTVSEKKEVERPAKKPEPIAEEPAASKRTNYHENTLEVNSLIVLESDEEEDEQLAQAADLVEQQYAAREKLSKPTSSVSSTYDYHRKPSSTLVDPPRRPAYEASAVDPPRRPVYDAPKVDLPRRQAYEASAAPSIPAAKTQTSSYDFLSNRPGRYSSYVRSPAQSYVTAEAPATSSYPRTYANELSDDNEAEDAQYESDFTRNLARLRAERIGDRSSPYSRRTVATGSVGYEPLPRRSLRPDDNSVSVAFGRWVNSLEQKYRIKSKLFILFVVLLLIGVYSIFF